MKDILLKDATHTISGNLTLKDSTKNITFPARITMDSATITATADFNIDRTLWGMNYKGPGNPQDWLINKQVNLNLPSLPIKNSFYSNIKMPSLKEDGIFYLT